MRGLTVPPVDLYKAVRPIKANGLTNFVNDSGRNKAKLDEFQFARAVLTSKFEVIRAINRLNRKKIRGTKVYIYSVADDQSDIDRNHKGKTKWIKMSNLTPTTTEEDIRQWICDRVDIDTTQISQIMLRHHMSMVYPSYCYVELNSPQVASQCVEYLNLEPLKERRIWITWILWEVLPREPELVADVRSERKVFIGPVHRSVWKKYYGEDAEGTEWIRCCVMSY